MKDKEIFWAQKTDEAFKLENKYAYKDFENRAPKGRYSIEIKREKKRKTHSQVKMIFGHMIQSAIEQAEDQHIGIDDLLVYLLVDNIPKGQAITKDFLHELMYVICPTTNEDGDRVTLSKMNTEQAASLFERFRTILAPLGINIVDPNPDWKKQS